MSLSELVDQVIEVTEMNVLDTDDCSYAVGKLREKVPELVAQFLEAHGFDPEDAR